MGTRRFLSLRPFGSTRESNSSPTGSGRDATFLTPPIISSSLALVSVRRSSFASERPFFLAASTSAAFFSEISARAASSLSASARSALFFSAVEAEARTYDAPLALRAASSMSNIRFPRLLPDHRGARQRCRTHTRGSSRTRRNGAP